VKDSSSVSQQVRMRRVVLFYQPVKLERKREGKTGAGVDKGIPRSRRRNRALLSSLTAKQRCATLLRENHDESRPYSICSATGIDCSASRCMPAGFAACPGSRRSPRRNQLSPPPLRDDPRLQHLTQYGGGDFQSFRGAPGASSRSPGGVETHKFVDSVCHLPNHQPGPRR